MNKEASFVDNIKTDLHEDKESGKTQVIYQIGSVTACCKLRNYPFNKNRSA